MIGEHGLLLPVGYGADAMAVAGTDEAFGAPDPTRLQSTRFVLGPDGNLIVSVVSSRAVGRLVPWPTSVTRSTGLPRAITAVSETTGPQPETSATLPTMSISRFLVGLEANAPSGDAPPRVGAGRQRRPLWNAMGPTETGFADYE